MKKSVKPNSASAYSDALIAGLIERYGVVNDESNEVEIPDEWYYLIDTFAMQYKLQKQCEKEIREKGICSYENGKRHPLLATLKELVASNMRILNLLGANPYYKERCKPKEQNDSDISAEDFISILTSSNYEGEE
nr:MAG TPA: terminase small subunit [Caudoviricetes sp.]